MMMAYVPTAEEEQQALALDMADDAEQKTDTPINAEYKPNNNEKEGEASVVAVTELPGSLDIGPDAIDAIEVHACTNASEPELEVNCKAGSVYFKTTVLYLNTLLSVWKEKGVGNEPDLLMVILGADSSKEVSNEQLIQEDVFKTITKDCTAVVIEANTGALSAANFDVMELLETIIPSTETVLTADAHPSISLCCVALPLETVMGLWKSGEENLSRLFVVDPPPFSAPVVPLPPPHAHASPLPEARSSSNSHASLQLDPRSTTKCTFPRALTTRPGHPFGIFLVNTCAELSRAGARHLACLPAWTKKPPLMRVLLKVLYTHTWEVFVNLIIWCYTPSPILNKAAV